MAFACGALSGSTAALITSPFDVLKTRRQALVMSAPTGEATRTIPLALQVLRNEGVSALFAGLSPRMAKIAPACGIMIASFEVSFVVLMLCLVLVILTIFLWCCVQGIGHLLVKKEDETTS